MDARTYIKILKTLRDENLESGPNNAVLHFVVHHDSSALSDIRRVIWKHFPKSEEWGFEMKFWQMEKSLDSSMRAHSTKYHEKFINHKDDNFERTIDMIMGVLVLIDEMDISLLKRPSQVKQVPRYT